MRQAQNGTMAKSWVIECSARKNTVFKNDTEVHVFHIGSHQCNTVKPETPFLHVIVDNALSVDPYATLAHIQRDVVLNKLRQQKPISEVMQSIETVTDSKSISNLKD